MTQDRDHLVLLSDINELGTLIQQSTDVDNFLQRTVEMIAHHLRVDVCSIYLYDEDSNELVLKATVGLNPAAVGKIRMACGMGLVGAALSEQRPVCEGLAQSDPRFKYFAEAGEEGYQSFLGVPILRGAQKTGVVVLQHTEADAFHKDDVLAVRLIAAQLAGVLENARMLIDLKELEVRSHLPGRVPVLKLVKGQSASHGCAIGPATIFDASHGKLDWNAPEAELTLDDFHRAVAATRDQLVHLQDRIAERLPESEALIFSAHFMILKDPQFLDRIITLIEEGSSVPRAIQQVAGHFIKLFNASAQAYIQEKSRDIEDLAGRILHNLREHTWSAPHGLYEGQVIIAPQLYPSEILTFAAENVQGIVLVSGGITSHVAILARSLQIPLIIAGDAALLQVPENTPLLLDAELGNIYINPEPEVIQRFQQCNDVSAASADLAQEIHDTTESADGRRVHLYANINLLREAGLARSLKAEGVGLYRTEFPFLIRTSFPSEEEQYLIYRRLCDEMAGKPVTFRTLDIGGDKLPAYWSVTGEPNPQLGLRSIRFSFAYPDIFTQQLRAILRAGADTARLRIMFPMISSLDEFRQARSLVLATRDALAAQGQEFHATPQLGVMVEVPATVEIIDELAREADFISIGTNDFVQYLLGADRMNEHVANYYRPEHPAVLRALARIARAAALAGKELSLCGEMALDERLLPFLLGIGITSLSVEPLHLPAIHKKIRALSYAKAHTLAERLLAEPTLAGVHAILGEN